jgi:5'-methylthioadenosine phosphorylase
MIGIIGGTGLYRLDGLQVSDRRWVDTPYGRPSAPIVLGRWHDRPIAFLARHGETHNLLPGEVNYRANLLALKLVGARRIIGVSAVGSLAAEIAPGELALASQYIDFTGGRRASTFFGEGLIAHVSTAEPACLDLEAVLSNTAAECGISLRRGATYACVAGPRLGTRAESHFLRLAGAQLVGMTNVPEAFLAREAQLCYCTVGVVTDFDCWQEDASLHVRADEVMRLYGESLSRVQNLLGAAVRAGAPDLPECACRRALEHAVITPPEALSAEKRELLGWLKL